MPESQLWLMLVNSVSGENKTARQRIWRALKASGAATLRDGVYLLPNSAEARSEFREQAEEVVAMGGSAHLLVLDAEDARQDSQFRSLFDRGAEYTRLFHEL